MGITWEEIGRQELGKLLTITSTTTVDGVKLIKVSEAHSNTDGMTKAIATTVVVLPESGETREIAGPKRKAKE
jgi:hypothetical protein